MQPEGFKKSLLIKIIVFLVIVFIVVLFLLINDLDKIKIRFFPKKYEEETQQEIVVEEYPKVIGSSVEGRKIEVYTFGDGEDHLIFVGGIHGGYERNSFLLAKEFIDYFENNPYLIPENIKISIIPVLNPDGLVLNGTEGRFNANNVDLNRNFDCKWKSESTWRGETVSAGDYPFSEPEAAALRDFILKDKENIKAVAFWHSKANAVYASECEDGILPETLEIMNAYSASSEYQAISVFDAYEVTGDAEGWLASIGIPAITVELETRDQIEWERNKRGVEAVLGYFRS
jgi:hypothetical protein